MSCPRFRDTQVEQVLVADTGLTLGLSAKTRWPIIVTGGESSHREVESGLNQIPDANPYEVCLLYTSRCV